MARIHFLNTLEGDCNIIQHDSGRTTVIDVSNAYNDYDTDEEVKVKQSQERRNRFERTQVPSDKKDYKQKREPDNPILYLKEIGVKSIFRFIITHPDMDHLDGIKDLFDEFEISNIWDTDNVKEMSNKAASGGYNIADWIFYKSIRNKRYSGAKRLTYYAGDSNLYYNEDYIKILCPTREILSSCNDCGNWNDSSYVLLYTPPKKNGGFWKILFAGDSEDSTWEYILRNFTQDISNTDILFAPHHGRDSGRSYEFLRTVQPQITLFGNASSKHLAYSRYPETRITNNQAGYVVLDIDTESVKIYVKNLEFARDFWNNPKRNWGEPNYSAHVQAYYLGQLDA